MCHDSLRYVEDMQLDIESLRVLLAVLDHGGMTRAAERLHMGQSAVSRKVQRLEDRVGRPLLIRDGHALRPTREGRALLTDARAMVDLHDRAVARLESSDLEGKVRLASNGEIDTSQIAAILGAFRRRHPGATVDFTVDHTGALVDWVEEGSIDVAIFQTTEDGVRKTDHRLWSEDLVWVTSSNESFVDGTIPMLDFGSCCYYNTFTHSILTNAGIDHRTAFSAPTSVDVRAAVQSGIGVAVMSARYLGDDVVEWEPPAELEPLPTIIQVIRTVPGERSEAVKALVETIRNELNAGHRAA